MTELKLTLDGAFVDLAINGKIFRLAAPRAQLSLRDPSGNASGSNASTPTTSDHIKLSYHDVDGILLGKPEDVLNAIQRILPSLDQNLEDTALSQKWGDVKTTLQGVPVIGSMITAATNTSVYVTDIVIELTRVQDKYSGSFTLGMKFEPPSNMSFLNTRLDAFGGIVTVALDGNVSDLRLDGWE